ncbi:MAG TPA: aromatic-ring-hydroxylating dioxygenase subunit beta [Candidatus Binatia bacterium]|nr:aromatic-ring-hydroxylating dioxygenase subunit beta [Candidatus Binatia bacterium]
MTSRGEIEQFVYREARLADEHQYDAWEALWTDDAIYWVPAGSDDPDRHMSIIYDNRSRIAVRVMQLKTGKRHAQRPPSSVRRVVSNVELLADDGDDLVVGANFVAVESRDRGTVIWAGRYEYRLRRQAGALRMVRKTVTLVDRDRPLPNLAFLI